MKKCNPCIIYDEIQESKNHLVLLMDKVYRLLGTSRDEEDYYYILQDMHGKVLLSSCVCGWTDLYNLLSKEDYERLDELFEINKFEESSVEDTTEALKENCYCE